MYLTAIVELFSLRLSSVLLKLFLGLLARD
jgi:hypothetical protein